MLGHPNTHFLLKAIRSDFFDISGNIMKQKGHIIPSDMKADKMFTILHIPSVFHIAYIVEKNLKSCEILNVAVFQIKKT